MGVSKYITMYEKAERVWNRMDARQEKIDLGYLLKCAREDCDLSQKKVMDLTGINNKTLSGYENNVSEPDFQTLLTLLRLYGFSMDSLIFPERSAQREPEKFLSIFYDLPPSVRDDLRVQIQALHEKYKK